MWMLYLYTATVYVSSLHCFFANVTPCPLVLLSSLTEKHFLYQYFHTHSHSDGMIRRLGRFGKERTTATGRHYQQKWLEGNSERWWENKWGITPDHRDRDQSKTATLQSQPSADIVYSVPCNYWVCSMVWTPATKGASKTDPCSPNWIPAKDHGNA